MNTNQGTIISWNRPMLDRFKEAHAAASKRNAETFVFDGQGFLIGYAKYLIEYLEGQFK